MEGKPISVQFLLGQCCQSIPGRKMLDRIGDGHGVDGNSSFIIRTSIYRDVGGVDPDLLYAGGHDLAACLYQTGDCLHADEPLSYGRHLPAASSSVNLAKPLDVRDYFHISAKVLQPRPFRSRNLIRFQWLTGFLTSHFLLNIALQRFRGHREYTVGLAKIVRNQGDIPLGLAFLPSHCLRRLLNPLTGRNAPRGHAPEPWMCPPTSDSVQTAR